MRHGRQACCWRSGQHSVLVPVCAVTRGDKCSTCAVLCSAPHLGLRDVVLGERPQLRRQLLPLHLQQGKALQRVRPASEATSHLSHLSIRVACLVPNTHAALQQQPPASCCKGPGHPPHRQARTDHVRITDHCSAPADVVGVDGQPCGHLVQGFLQVPRPSRERIQPHLPAPAAAQQLLEGAGLCAAGTPVQAPE